MRIAFLSYNRDPSIPHIDNDGCPVTVRNYAIELGNRGHAVDVYANRVLPTAISSAYIKSKYSEQKESEVTLSKNVRVVRVPARQYPVQSVRLPDKLADVPEIAESFASAGYFQDGKLHEYDVVCFFHPLSSFGVISQGLAPVERSVIFPMLLSSEYKKYQSVSRIYEAWESFALTTVQAVFSSSKAERDSLRVIGVNNDALKLVHRGYDSTVFRYNQKSNSLSRGKTLRIVSVGAIRPQKNYEQLLEVIKILKASGYNPNVTIVGDNEHFIKKEYKEYYEHLLTLVNTYNLENLVRFAGALEPTDISTLMQHSDVGVFCSTSESFGKAALEAICSGVPTVLSEEVLAYREFAEDEVNALLYAGTAESCFDSIQRLVEDAMLYKRLSTRGATVAAAFSWQSVTSILETLLCKI
jgi:glycosyltransferase involved in cell wall biosynthesis